MAYAETVMFAIQAGLRLYGATRKAYADSVRGTALILPLPRAPGVKVDSARSWFLSPVGRPIVDATPRLTWLLTRGRRSKPQDAELIDLYLFHRSQLDPAEDGATDVRGAVSTLEMSSMLEIRQWSDSEASATATPLQRITGTLVNIAVDYFVQTPGAVDDDRPAGRALKSFLQALDDTDFATVPPDEISSGLMIALLETVAENPRLLGGGRNEQAMISNVTKGLATSARGFLENADDKKRRDAGAWLQLIGHAVFKGAAETVLAEPGRFLGLKPGAETEVVVEVATTMTGLLLGDKQVTFRKLFSAEGLDKVTRSALGAVAKNPELLKVDNQGLRNVIVALADNLAKVDGKISIDLFPEVVRLVLDKTADNLDLVWGKSFSSPQRHLLVTAVGQLMKSVAKKPVRGSTWKPKLTPDQLLEVAEVVLDEVIDNPAWLIDSAGGSNVHVQAAIDAILAALRATPGNRISAQTGVAVLRAGIGAVASRLSLLDELPATATEPARVAVSAALDAIFSQVFQDGVDAAASWKLARNSTLSIVVDLALDRLAEFGSEQKHIAALHETVKDELASAGRFDAVSFGIELATRLAAA